MHRDLRAALAGSTLTLAAVASLIWQLRQREIDAEEHKAAERLVVGPGWRWATSS